MWLDRVQSGALPAWQVEPCASSGGIHVTRRQLRQSCVAPVAPGMWPGSGVKPKASGLLCGSFAVPVAATMCHQPRRRCARHRVRLKPCGTCSACTCASCIRTVVFCIRTRASCTCTCASCARAPAAARARQAQQLPLANDWCSAHIFTASIPCSATSHTASIPCVAHFYTAGTSVAACGGTGCVFVPCLCPSGDGSQRRLTSTI